MAVGFAASLVVGWHGSLVGLPSTALPASDFSAVGTGLRECPKGTKGKWPDCKKIVRSCPKGTSGKWPNCNKIVRSCPKGTIGKWPNCKDKPVASCADKVLVGLWPNCRKPERRRCPSGAAGDWPNCSAITKDDDCPSGRVRKGGTCVKVTTGGSDGKAPPRVAPAGEPEEILPAIAALTADRPHRPCQSER